jgi:hypothetical protein
MFGTFFTISASDTAQIIGYSGDLITDVTPLLLIIVGVAVGIFIFWAIVSAIKH